jgi:predicted AAA+ superfamily ATPase
MYINREIDLFLAETFRQKQSKGLIVSGIVGSGKTTAVENYLKTASTVKNVYKYTGDDIQFRNEVTLDSKYLYHDILAKQNPAKETLIFVDEVQKSEAIFDAVKYAFDQGSVSFIITGSNPGYLNTVARSRLQRRADFVVLMPFSLPEILGHKKLIPEGEGGSSHFSNLLFQGEIPNFQDIGLERSPEMLEEINRYLLFGGLPLAYLCNPGRELVEIRQTVERGILSLIHDSENLIDIILLELAKLHSREFTYTHIFGRTGTRKRDTINAVLNDLINQGYLLSKTPFFRYEARRSYLKIFSLIDPGIHTYLIGDTDFSLTKGQKIEGLVHARLQFLRSQRPLKNTLHYFKPYKPDPGKGIKFLPGEIDFIFQEGNRIVPIEVKATDQIHAMDVQFMEEYVHNEKLPMGIVLYGGMPFVKNRIVFYPWWLI